MTTPPTDAPIKHASHGKRGGAMMMWYIVLRSAFKALMANKMRSILAMLGIIMGIAAVIAMLSMGAGAQSKINAQFTSMGTNLLFVRPTQKMQGGASIGIATTLTVEDAEFIAQLPGVSAVSPVIQGRLQVKHQENNKQTSINGVAMPYFKMRNFIADKGRHFSEAESEGGKYVIVLGANLASNLFGADDPIGDSVKVNGKDFEVIGVNKSKGDTGFNNPDDQAYIPYTTAKVVVSNLDYLREIDIAVMEGEDVTKVSGQPPGVATFGPQGNRGGTVHISPPPADSVTTLLRKRHKLFELKDPDDFTMQNQAELLASVNESAAVFKYLLATIASISLLVGGIGIMNIMLVTVTERTREIGVRKAIGAKNRTILTQFVVEAVFLSGVGGLLGAVIGVGTSWLIAIGVAKGWIPNQVPVPIVSAIYVIVSVAVSAFVGIIFGVYPAYKAAQLDPIDALRYE